MLGNGSTSKFKREGLHWTGYETPLARHESQCRSDESLGSTGISVARLARHFAIVLDPWTVGVTSKFELLACVLSHCYLEQCWQLTSPHS